jgi:hypothetical protein
LKSQLLLSNHFLLNSPQQLLMKPLLLRSQL